MKNLDSGQPWTSWGAHNQGMRLADAMEQFDDAQHVTPADDLCLFGKAGRRCGCGFCREQVFKQREGGERI